MGEIAITKECPVCGKQFVILYPHLWAYKRGAGKNGSARYFCSWKCLRELDNEGERKRGNVRICKEENEKEAIRIFLEGGDHLKYLKDLGIKAPSVKWYEIRGKLKDTDPELYAKTGRPGKAVETPEGEFVPVVPKAPKAVETPETPKITAPISYDGFKVRGISGRFGSYHFQDINGKQWLDYDDNESSNQLSMTVEQWRDFIAELRRAALVLGVEL